MTTIENCCPDTTSNRDNLERIGSRRDQVTDLPYYVYEREVVLIDDVRYTERTIKATLKALYLSCRA